MSAEKKDKFHFIIVLDGSAYQPMYEQMLYDLAGMKNVSLIVEDKHNTYLKEILLKRKVQFFTRGHLDFLSFERNKLYHTIEKKYSEAQTLVVVFFNASLHYNHYLADTLYKYKHKWNGIKFVLFYLDIVGVGVSRNADYLRNKKVFDLIYSVDSSDCKKYHLIPYSTFYSVDQRMKTIFPINDLYFCGTPKDRSFVLKECANEALEHGIQFSMDIACGEDNDLFFLETPGINILEDGKYLDYRAVLKNELQAKCILEVCQKGQDALTLRPYEAVAYNRKLLSNNKAILNFTFFDERYIRYFDKVEDIDWDWVRDNTLVDYGYKGEFSPYFLLSDISRRILN